MAVVLQQQRQNVVVVHRRTPRVVASREAPVCCCVCCCCCRCTLAICSSTRRKDRDDDDSNSFDSFTSFSVCANLISAFWNRSMIAVLVCSDPRPTERFGAALLLRCSPPLMARSSVNARVFSSVVAVGRRTRDRNAFQKPVSTVSKRAKPIRAGMPHRMMKVKWWRKETVGRYCHKVGRQVVQC